MLHVTWRKLPQYLQDNPLHKSTSALLQSQWKKENKRWQHLWKKSPGSMHTSDMDPKILARSYLTLTTGMCRSHMRILTWLCTRHCPLNRHLYKIKIRPMGNCAHCPGIKEDIPHFLFACLRYSCQRHQMTQTLSRCARSLQYLLMDQKGMEHLLCFVVATSCSQMHQISQLTPNHT